MNVFSFHMKGKNFILDIHIDKRTVFQWSDIAMLSPEEKSKYLSNRIVPAYKSAALEKRVAKLLKNA